MPTITHSLIADQPFPVQVQRGEAEAYGLSVNTFHGKRLMRLLRMADGHGSAVWCCHPHNEGITSLWSGRGATAQAAVDAAIKRLAV